MAFNDCLLRAKKEGKISDQQYAQAAKYAEAMGPEKAAQLLNDQILGKKLGALKAFRAKQRMDENIGREGNRPVKALNKSMNSVALRTAELKRHFARGLSDFVQKFTRGHFGLFKNAGDLESFGRAVYQEGKQDAAFTKLAEGYKEMQNEVRRLAQNTSGIKMNELERYGLPTAHDAVALNRSGFDKWFADVTDPNSGMAPDWKTMTDHENRPFATYSDQERKNWAKGMWDNIVSDDWTRASKNSYSLAERFNQRRYFEFADYTGWKAYNKAYGVSSDPVMAVEHHLSSSARDIAMMDEYGPNPASTINYGREAAMSKAGKIRSENSEGTNKWTPVDYAKSDLKKFDAIYDGFMGDRSPVTTGAAAYGVGRNLIYASQVLGKALFAQLTNDPIFRVPNLKMVYGLPGAQIIETAANYIKHVGGKEGRQLAMRLAISAEGELDNLRSSTIQMRDHPIYGASYALPDAVGRLFGVHAHMEALPTAFGEAMLSWMARTRDMNWNALAKEYPAWTAALERENIGADDWEAMRKTPVYTNRGVEYLVPDDLRATDYETGMKWGMMVNKVSREAVPAFNLESKYSLMGGIDPNSFMGMIVRDATIALHFTASTLKMWTSGLMMRQGTASKMSYAAASGLTLIMASMLQQQMKALVSGRDPYNMNPNKKEGVEAWMMAAERSGFAGPALDLLNPQHKGGVLGTAMQAASLVWKEGGFLLHKNEKDPNATGKLFGILRNLIPGANGWYTQLLLQNTMLDQVQREIDPQAYENWNHSQSYYQQHYGQGEWWARGQGAPSRAPDFSKAFQ